MNENTIWKYALDLGSDELVKGVPPAPTMSFTLDMPARSKVLCVQEQNNQPVVWALVNPESLMAKRTFDLYETGKPCDVAGKKYIGTVQLKMGVPPLYSYYVLHVFEN